ncbi:MAG: hypothetical protein WC565_03405 [Parcubacteria group bacterium]|jgi:hypothetical protein
MVAYVDPKKCAYAPESLAEAQEIATVAAGGTVAAKYYDWPPFYVEIERLTVEQDANTTAIVSADGYARKQSFHSRAGPQDNVAGIHAVPNRSIAKDSLEIMLNAETGTPSTNIKARWNMTVRDPTILDKLRLNRSMKSNVVFSTAEEAIIEKYALNDMIDIGVAPRNEDLLGDNVYKWFDEIIQVSRRIPAIADGEELVVGGDIKVPQRKVYTLLGIAFDSAAMATVAAGAITANELWIKVDRDAVNDYMVLDALAMPETTAGDMNETVRLFIPAVEKFSVRLVNDSGGAIAAADSLDLRFFYGVRDMNVIDHIKWNYPFFSTAEEEKYYELEEKYLLKEKVAAGLLDNLQPPSIAMLK